MPEENTPNGARKKVLPVALAGAAVAIAAALFLLFSTGRANKAITHPAESTPSTEQSAAPDSTVVQTAQFGQSDPNAPAPPIPAQPGGASVVSPDGAAISFSDESITYSAAFPPGANDDPNLAYLRKDALSYLASKKADARAT